jgi:hypothetical protein
MTLYVLPRLGKAGLGNELFAYLRAVEYASESPGAVLVAPRWFQFRIGPTLRGERDKRQYWTLFPSPSLTQRVQRRAAERRARIDGVSSASANRGQHHEGTGNAGKDSVVVFSGMDGYFAPFVREGAWHRAHLLRVARPTVVSPAPTEPFLSVHVRLGDFKRPEAGAVGIQKNNTSTPIGWYEQTLQSLRRRFPDVPIVISSDGTNDELSPLLMLDGVSRSTARNALDEIILLSYAAGILGSRSTFSAWGAFLGDTPLLVAPGGNAYAPHSRVWESEAGVVPPEWLDPVRTRLEK